MKIIDNDVYFVQKEDSLESISKKFNINSTTLLIKNNITPKMITTGFILVVK